MLITCYYCIKPLIPRRLQLLMRRWIAVWKRQSCKDVWPIDRTAGKLPAEWHGWPGGKQFAVVLTHDVDTQRGHDRCLHLMALEQQLGFRSSFNFVAENYQVSVDLRHHLVKAGFEIGLHGLRHNRDLFESKEEFERQSVLINEYLSKWGAVGFRSPCMYHNLEWMHGLNISYDASTFDTDPFEPQPDGLGTIFPHYITDAGKQSGYVELPYTLPQDFTLFVLFKEHNIDVWKQKLDWIAEHGGMVLLNSHPDYMNFDSNKTAYDQYPVGFYLELLEYIKQKYTGRYWQVLPRDMAEYWKIVAGMKPGTAGDHVCAERWDETYAMPMYDGVLL